MSRRDLRLPHGQPPSFNALRQDSVDLRQDFAVLRDHVDKGFVEMRGTFDVMAAGQQEIVGLLQTIIAKKGRGGTNE